MIQSRATKLKRTISGIDRDNNGYVTNQELDDILKLHYNELKGFSLIPHFARFQDAIQSVLVGYKQFLKAI